MSRLRTSGVALVAGLARDVLVRAADQADSCSSTNPLDCPGSLAALSTSTRGSSGSCRAVALC